MNKIKLKHMFYEIIRPFRKTTFEMCYCNYIGFVVVKLMGNYIKLN